MLAESTSKRGQYCAFNKAIVEEAKAKMPANMNCSTVHSLAYRVKGAPMRHRLNAPRVTSTRIAQILRIDPIFLQVQGVAKVLQPAFLASLVMQAISHFCNSADKEPTGRHVPYIDGIDVMGAEGKRRWENNNAVSDTLAPFIRAAWADLQNVDGKLRYSHDCYVKVWELDGPRIDADFILMDEAQDSSPVFESIFIQQDHAQLVVVGDANQAIYQWRGAVDALSNFKELGNGYAQLSRSFRFGPEIADVANLLLGELGADLRLTGTDTIASEVGTVGDDADAILTRTNAEAVTTLLSLKERGRKVCILGGGKEMTAFARAAQDLQAGRSTSYGELACFNSWDEVRAYVDEDPSGTELKLSVSLVERFGAETIIEALAYMPKEEAGVTVVSTSHKAKGREWGRVRLAADFNKKPNKDGEKPAPSPDDLRLLYVAATRAQLRLDVSACEPVSDLMAPQSISEVLPL